MIPISIAKISEIVGGQAHHVDYSTVISNIVTDSREASAGAMFIAIVGEHVDGHDFAAGAVAIGASVVLARRKLEQPCIVVPDPVFALGVLAHWVRKDLLTSKVIAVTGSSGKTSTKDLLAQVLSVAGNTVAAEGSFNTEVGVPLTIMRADTATQFLVLEMGMRGEGHLTYLCDIAEPDISAIVNIGTAHLGVVGTQAIVARAKGEIISALPAAGFAILNSDDAHVMNQAARTSAQVVTCGEVAGSDVRATDVRVDGQARASFTLSIGHESEPVALRYHGRHFVSNALIVAGIAHSLGLGIETIAMALRAATPTSKWRMEVHQLAHGVTMINDTYNANPESTRAALDTLAAMAAGRHTWLVLGEMRELGEVSEVEHAKIGAYAAAQGIDDIIWVGEGTLPAFLGARDAPNLQAPNIKASWVPDAEGAISALQSRMSAGDVVLIKASRSIGLEVVASALMQPGTP